LCNAVFAHAQENASGANAEASTIYRTTGPDGEVAFNNYGDGVPVEVIESPRASMHELALINRRSEAIRQTAAQLGEARREREQQRVELVVALSEARARVARQPQPVTTPGSGYYFLPHHRGRSFGHNFGRHGREPGSPGTSAPPEPSISRPFGRR
jgi:hypothetical protein